MPRPTATVDDPQVRRVLGALAAGHYIERAGRLAQVSSSTIHYWKHEGHKERLRVEAGLKPTERGQKYLGILEAIERAQDQASHKAMQAIMEAAESGTWQAAAWYLERTDPDHYARRTLIAGHDNGPLRVTVSPEDVDAKLMGMIAAVKASEEEHESGRASSGTS
jgi:hypothetical protein